MDDKLKKGFKTTQHLLALIKLVLKQIAKIFLKEKKMLSSIFELQIHLKKIFFVLENIARILTVKYQKCAVTIMCKTLFFVCGWRSLY